MGWFLYACQRYIPRLPLFQLLGIIRHPDPHSGRTACNQPGILSRGAISPLGLEPFRAETVLCQCLPP